MRIKMSRDLSVGFIVLFVYIFSQVNSQSCPAIPNVAQVCSPGTFSGARVLVDMSTFTGQSNSCSCSFNTTAKVLKIVTYNAPNYQDCNSAIRLSSSSGNSVRFECLMSGTYLDTSVHNTGEVMFETYAAAYDNNYCLVMELADAPGSEIVLSCEGSSETTTQIADGTTPIVNEILPPSLPAFSDLTANLSVADSTSTPPVTESTPTIPETGSTSTVPVADSIAKVSVTDSPATIAVTDATAKVPVTGSTAKIQVTDSTTTVAVTDSTAKVSVTDSTTKVSVTYSTAKVPLTDSTAPVAVTDSSAKVSVTDSTAAVPVTDSTTAVPVTDSTAVPVTDSTAAVPVTDSTAAVPVTDSTAAVPVTDSTTAIPATDSTAPVAITDSTVKVPVTNSTAAVPLTDSTAKLSVADVTVNAIVTDATAELPITDSTAKTLVTDSTAKVPVTISTATVHVTDPTAKIPVTGPTVKHLVTSTSQVTDSSPKVTETDFTAMVSVKDSNDINPITDSTVNVAVTDNTASFLESNSTTKAPGIDYTTATEQITDSPTNMLVTDSATTLPPFLSSSFPNIQTTNVQSIADSTPQQTVTSKNSQTPQQDISEQTTITKSITFFSSNNQSNDQTYEATSTSTPTIKSTYNVVSTKDVSLTTTQSSHTLSGSADSQTSMEATTTIMNLEVGNEIGVNLSSPQISKTITSYPKNTNNTFTDDNANNTHSSLDVEPRTTGNPVVTKNNETNVTEIVSGTVLLHGGGNSEKRYQPIDLVKSETNSADSMMIPSSFSPPELREAVDMSFVTEKINSNSRYNQPTTTAVYNSFGTNARADISTSNYWLTNAYAGKDTSTSTTKTNNEVSTNIYGIAITKEPYANIDYQYVDQAITNRNAPSSVTDSPYFTRRPIGSVYDSTQPKTGHESTPTPYQYANVDYNSNMDMTTRSYGVKQTTMDSGIKQPWMTRSPINREGVTQGTATSDRTTNQYANTDYNSYMGVTPDSASTKALGQGNIISDSTTSTYAAADQTNSNNDTTNSYTNLDANSYSNMNMNTEQNINRGGYQNSFNNDISTHSLTKSDQDVSTISVGTTAGNLRTEAFFSNYGTFVDNNVDSASGYVNTDNNTQVMNQTTDNIDDSYVIQNKDVSFENYTQTANETDILQTSQPILTEDRNNGTGTFPGTPFVNEELATKVNYSGSYNDSVQDLGLTNQLDTNTNLFDTVQNTNTETNVTDSEMTTNRPADVNTKPILETTDMLTPLQPSSMPNTVDTMNTFISNDPSRQLTLDHSPTLYQNNEIGDVKYNDTNDGVNNSILDNTTNTMPNYENVHVYNETKLNADIAFDIAGISFVSEMKPTTSPVVIYPAESVNPSAAATDNKETTASNSADFNLMNSRNKDTSYTSVAGVTTVSPMLYPTEPHMDSNSSDMLVPDGANFIHSAVLTNAITDTPTTVSNMQDTSLKTSTTPTLAENGSPISGYTSNIQPWTESAKTDMTSTSTTTQSADIGVTFLSTGAETTNMSNDRNTDPVSNTGFENLYTGVETTKMPTERNTESFMNAGFGNVNTGVETTNVPDDYNTNLGFINIGSVYNTNRDPSTANIGDTTTSGYGKYQTTTTTDKGDVTAIVVPSNAVEEKPNDVYAFNAFESNATNTVDSSLPVNKNNGHMDNTVDNAPISTESSILTNDPNSLLKNYEPVAVNTHTDFTDKTMTTDIRVSTESSNIITDSILKEATNSDVVSTTFPDTQYTAGSGTRNLQTSSSTNVPAVVDPFDITATNDANLPSNNLITTESQQSSKTVVKLESTVDSNLADIFPTTVAIPEEEVITINETQTPTALPTAPAFVVNDSEATTGSDKVKGNETPSINTIEQTTLTSFKSVPNTNAIMTADSAETTRKSLVHSTSTARSDIATTKDKKSTPQPTPAADPTSPKKSPVTPTVSTSVKESTTKLITSTTARIPPKIVVKETVEKKELPVLKNLPPVIEVKPSTKGPLSIAPEDTFQIADRDNTQETSTKQKEDMNVSFGDNLKAGLFDVNNNTYIIVVAVIAGLVVVAAVIGIVLHHNRRIRSDKVDISGANGANGVEPISHKNIAFENGDPETGNGSVQQNGSAENGSTIEMSENGLSQQNGNKGSIEE